MLFDLQGKRRRLIQATYLTLAVLMAGGLVFFGIGSDVQGGLADIFSGEGSGDANPAIEEQLEEAEQRLATNPDDPQALTSVARANYQLAADVDDEARATGQIFSDDATPRLEAAADAWSRYLELDPRNPDPSLAFLMTQVYGQAGLAQPEEAAEAAQIVARERNDPQAYLVWTQYAALAGNERQAELAGRRAVELAPESQKQQVERQVDALLRAASGQGAGAGGGGSGQGGN